MKLFLTLTLTLFIIAPYCFSQTDHNGNPVFNSISTADETIKDFQLLSNYYTLQNNIENKGSSVFVSEQPTLDEVEKAATQLPSEFFVVMKDRAPISMIMMLNSPKKRFFVIHVATGKQEEFECGLDGEISENRANEMIKLGYDKKAEVKEKKLSFNNKTFTIIPNEETKKAVLQLIETKGLSEGKGASTKIRSKEELKTLVLTESKAGGQLDFFSEIKGHEMDGIQLKPGLFDTKIGLALYKWGRANFELGVNTLEDALAIWAELKGRKADRRESEYIRLWFNKELEK